MCSVGVLENIFSVVQQANWGKVFSRTCKRSNEHIRLKNILLKSVIWKKNIIVLVSNLKNDYSFKNETCRSPVKPPM